MLMCLTVMLSGVACAEEINTQKIKTEKFESAANNEKYFDTDYENIKSMVFDKDNIIITGTKAIYTFSVTPAMLPGLLPPTYKGKSYDDFNQWYTDRQQSSPILSDVVVDADHTSVHATINIKQDRNSNAQTHYTLTGTRTVIAQDSGDNKNRVDISGTELLTRHESKKEPDNDFILGFDAQYNNERMTVKIFDNHEQIVTKKIDAPFKKADEALHNAAGVVTTPLFLLFCHAPCLPGG